MNPLCLSCPGLSLYSLPTLFLLFNCVLKYTHTYLSGRNVVWEINKPSLIGTLRFWGGIKALLREFPLLSSPILPQSLRRTRLLWKQLRPPALLSSRAPCGFASWMPPASSQYGVICSELSILIRLNISVSTTCEFSFFGPFRVCLAEWKPITCYVLVQEWSI